MRGQASEEAVQRHVDRAQIDRHFSDQLVERLTFFIISVELVSCGYMLLNAKEFGVIQSAGEIYVVGGLAAFLGILWRYFFNQSYFYGLKGAEFLGMKRLLLGFFYYGYIALTVLFFIGLIYYGYQHIEEFSH